jgi:hypothetical protein
MPDLHMDLCINLDLYADHKCGGLGWRGVKNKIFQNPLNFFGTDIH